MERRQVLVWFSALGFSKVLRGTPKATPEPSAPYLPSCLHPNGRWVALPGPKGDPIELWDIHTGQRAAVLPGLKAEDYIHPRGLGTAMSTRNRSYCGFDGALFTGPSALVGSYWESQCGRYSWVVGLPGSILANRHIRITDSNSDAVPKAIPKAAWDCLASLNTTEVFHHSRMQLQASFQGEVWTITQGGAHRVLAEFRPPSLPDPTFSSAPCVAFSPSGNTAAISHHGCRYDPFAFTPIPRQPTVQVLLWPWRSKAKRSTINLGRGDISKIHPIDEARWVAALHQHTFSTRSQIPLGKTRLVELPSLKEFTPSIAETQPCQMGVDLKQGILVAQYGAGTVRCYDLSTRRLTRLLTAFMPHQGLIAWGSNNRYLLAARPLGATCLWDRQGRSTKEAGCMDELIRPPIAELGMETRCLAWSPERDLLVQGCEDGGIRAFRRSGLRFGPNRDHLRRAPKPQNLLWQLPGEGFALRVLTFVGKEWMVGLEHGGRLRLWSLANRRIQAQVQAHPLRANAMVIDQANHRIFTGGHDGVRCWSLPDLQPGVVLETQGHWVSALALAGKHLAVGCLDGVIRLFDPDTGQLRWKVEAHGGWVGGLDFSSAGVLASGGEDCNVALWDTDKGGQLKRCQAGGNLPQWSPDGSWLAVYAHDRVKLLTPDLVFKDSERNHLKLDWGDDYT